MFGLPKRIVIFDTECTTWDGAAARRWSGPKEHRELVQIGAALVETENFIEQSVYKAIVKPRINPTLSNYFVNLTKITQERVDRGGVDFSIFLQGFKYWYYCGGANGFYCFDTKTDGLRLFDRDVLLENCHLYDIKFPFQLEWFHNINKIFVRYGIIVKQSGMAPAAFGGKPNLSSHDAMNDVRGLIEGLKLLKKKVA